MQLLRMRTITNYEVERNRRFFSNPKKSEVNIGVKVKVEDKIKHLRVGSETFGSSEIDFEVLSCPFPYTLLLSSQKRAKFE